MTPIPKDRVSPTFNDHPDAKRVKKSEDTREVEVPPLKLQRSPGTSDLQSYIQFLHARMPNEHKTN